MSSVIVEGNISGTGSVTIAAPNTNSDFTVTLPTGSGELVSTGGAQTIQFAAGSASTPSITTTGDTNTGIFFPAADTIAFAEGGAEAMRIDSSGNVGIGTTSPASYGKLHVRGVQNIATYGNVSGSFSDGATGSLYVQHSSGLVQLGSDTALSFGTGSSSTERARIDSSGNLLVATTNTTPATANVVGYSVNSNGIIYNTVDSNPCVYINRKTNDGELVRFYQDGTQEGSISVSGSTVSYNGGHLSRWAQMLTKPDLLKGTVMSNLDEMNVYVDADGNPVQNEQLNKVKVSDVEGDANVAGVFVNWDYDEAHQVDEINMAMTGDMIIRIAQGTTVARGDLLMSAGDGTAKPQGDDIVRSKTIAKVTSTHVTCTYDDGSYCVPCVLMAC
jgi:hypothetical protein